MRERRFWIRLCGYAFFLSCLHIAATHAASDTTPVRTIYLIRHGSYAPDPKANPETGPALTALGLAQARLIASRLRGVPVKFDSITSSAMTRAQQTAAVIHESLPQVPTSASPLLTECTPTLPAAMQGTESAAGQTVCTQRLDQAFAKFAVPAQGSDKNDVLVCHGNVIRYFVTRALGADARVWPVMSVAHVSMTIIQIGANGGYRILAVGDAGHVPPSLLSYGSDADPQLLAPNLDGFVPR